jgi:NAD(P) transhydrogenase subunit alpha
VTTPLRIGVPKETVARETRVALVPDSVARLVKAGATVAVEHGAGLEAACSDEAYVKAGAVVVGTPAEAFRDATLIAKVQRPTADEIRLMPRGVVLVSLLPVATSSDTVRHLADARVTSFSLELVPRITRAQSMDVLSSQSTVAGYKAVLIGAAALGRFLPMLTTAAGNIPPARVFVLGAGVAGLQAIATARRLGAVVSAFDVRSAAREQVQSLGATFVAAELASPGAETTGGYAKELAQDQHLRELEVIGAHLRDVDLAITTALIPGRPAPRLIEADMLTNMRRGSVIVDLAADAGGNCAVTVAGETVERDGVRVIGPLNVAATVPVHASQMLSRNITSLLLHLLADGQLQLDLSDEIVAAMVVTHDGQIRAPGGPK